MKHSFQRIHDAAKYMGNVRRVQGIRIHSQSLFFDSPKRSGKCTPVQQLRMPRKIYTLFLSLFFSRGAPRIRSMLLNSQWFIKFSGGLVSGLRLKLRKIRLSEHQPIRDAGISR
jgi:hypothetical protein